MCPVFSDDQLVDDVCRVERHDLADHEHAHLRSTGRGLIRVIIPT